MNGKKIGLGVILSVVASVIAIFVFVTGYDSVPTIIRGTDNNDKSSMHVVGSQVDAQKDEQQSEVSASTSPIEIPTANLYINEEHGFHFYYPTNWGEQDIEETLIALSAIVDGYPGYPLMMVFVFIEDYHIWLEKEYKNEFVEEINGREFLVQYDVESDVRPGLLNYRYWYTIDRYNYMVMFSCEEYQREICLPLFKSIMNSYVVSV